MPVAADDRLAVLPSQSGDPDVVLWNRPAFLAELIPHLRVRLGCRLIDPQDEGFSDKGLQKTLEVDAEARAEQPVPVLLRRSGMSSKIDIGKIVSDHWSTLRNHNTKRVSLGDIALFLVLPTGLSWFFRYRRIMLSDGLANVLTTAFSIFAALLFNLLLLVYDLLKKEEASEEPNKLRHDLLDEVSKNISFSILIALFVIIFLILNAIKLEGPVYQQSPAAPNTKAARVAVRYDGISGSISGELQWDAWYLPT